PTPLAQSLPASVPFVGPEAQERAMGQPFQARLGANESVFGPAPSAIEAMRNAAQDVWMYGDPESHDLRMALAKHHGVPAGCIVVGAGIDGLLGSLARLFVAPGDPVVTSDGAYPTFNYHATGYGGQIHKVPFKADKEDPEGLVLEAARIGAKLIYFANPDNPMGSWHDERTVRKMIDAVPDGSLLALDEAYVEFAPAGTAPPLDTSAQNVIRMRTFSKAYGMAGARIGYAIGHPEIISAFHKVRNHFGVGRISQIGALAALGDQDWLAHVCGEVESARVRLADIARDNGLAALPSATNFVTLDCGGDGARARALVSALAEFGIFVRMPFVSPGDRCIRVSCGTPGDLNAFAAALPKALAAIADERA
ncbi:MAG: pyridoxal phosphate-dependent aminotransferase, partial [Alphaproteobacteria bacterium]|nr:pyridoxal phosphate-dependent aminotransferase [Alphaproteobacteria bacterium]